MSYIIPAINSTGKFSLAVPFNNLLSDLEEYKVIAIRGIKELLSDNPLDNIYTPVGLTIEDMEEDVKNDIPIVVLISTSEEYLYVPADKILTIPITSGAEYQEKVLSISLGLLPVKKDLSIITEIIEELIYDGLGVKSESKVIESSAKILLDNIKDKQLRQLRENRVTVTKSNRTKYLETVALLNKKNTLIKNLEQYILKLKNES